MTFLSGAPCINLLTYLLIRDVVVRCTGTAVIGGPHEERLIDDILRHRNYTALARPVAEESEALVVSFGLSLQQIIKIVSQFTSTRYGEVLFAD